MCVSSWKKLYYYYYIYIQPWSELLAPLVNMTKEGSENKVQIPLIIITMRKTKEYISDVQQKIIELHKLVKWL